MINVHEKHHVSWFYCNKNEIKPNFKTVFPFSVFWPCQHRCLYIQCRYHSLYCLCLSFVFPSWYKKKHLIGYLYCFNQWNSVCQAAFIIRNESRKMVSHTQNTAGEKCKPQFSSEWGYGAGRMAFPIPA